MTEATVSRKIVIVGGGFGGVRVALDLAKNNIPNTKIVLVSDKPHFEYHAALYRVVTGRSPLETCIPLAEIFSGKDVEVVEDTIIKVDAQKKKLTGSSGSHYAFDYLVLALGSETSYFDLPGLKEYSFGFKSITDALRLKRHLHEMVSSCVLASDREKECALRFIIVGGGATGVELAGELAIYTRNLAKKHQLEEKLITIDLIQASDCLLPYLPADVSQKAKERLEGLGVRVLVGKRVVKEEIETIYLEDMKMKTKTVIWTAGVVPHHLYGEIKGLSFDEKGKVVVDDYLQPMSSRPSPPAGGRVEGSSRGFTPRGSHTSESVERPARNATHTVAGGDSSTASDAARNDNVDNVFVIGDAAATAFAGMAQTALYQGSFVADFIDKTILGVKPLTYSPRKPFYAIPIGLNWAIFINSVRLFGAAGWFLRRIIDLRFFLSILPVGKALAVFQSGKSICEQCGICSEDSSMSS